MRIFKTKQFERIACKNHISDELLQRSAIEIGQGKYEADLGGGVIKKRIAREGEGKSGGYRAIVCFRHGLRLFFAYSYAKADRSNITNKELIALRKLADQLLGMSEEELQNFLENGYATEMKGGEDENL